MTCCRHKRGDFFLDMWICADCYSPLHERPKVYGTRYHFDGHPNLQEIVWNAETATCDGVSLGQFLTWMVSYLRMRSLWTRSKEQSLRECLEVLRCQGEPFGGKYASWTKGDAKELVKEGILAYWYDCAGSGGSNQ